MMSVSKNENLESEWELNEIEKLLPSLVTKGLITETEKLVIASTSKLGDRQLVFYKIMMSKNQDQTSKIAEELRKMTCKLELQKLLRDFVEEGWINANESLLIAGAGSEHNAQQLGVYRIMLSKNPGHGSKILKELRKPTTGSIVHPKGRSNEQPSKTMSPPSALKTLRPPMTTKNAIMASIFCQKCGSPQKSFLSLEKHLENFCPGEPFQCNKCDFYCPVQTQLEAHMRKSHPFQ